MDFESSIRWQQFRYVDPTREALASLIRGDSKVGPAPSQVNVNASRARCASRTT